MKIIKSLCIAISTYSVIPMPRFTWEEDNLRYAIAAFPVVGLFIGGLLLLWQLACAALGLGSLLFAAMACLLPVAVSGGIHMDGFCDTVDALASRQPKERKLEILQDSRVGAFAVIYLAAYLLLTLGLYSEMAASRALAVVACGFVLSRALTALTALLLRNARGTGMLASFIHPASAKAACCISAFISGLAVALMLACYWQAAVGALLLSAVTVIVYRRLAIGCFGGVTGDTSGFFLQMCELAILLGALAGDIASKLVVC